MRFGPKVLLLLALIGLGGYFASKVTDGPSGESKGFTFRLTLLTEPPVHVQHGIETYITLNMIEPGGTDAVRIDEPPPFPLTATLEYQTVDGQKRKVSSSYGYRC